jgi:GT2 family glycosyltransferase
MGGPSAHGRRLRDRLRSGERAVSIVVVAYGSPEPLRRTLTALDARHPVVVVDNSSSEATRQVCEELGARYLDPGRNVGFAAGVNIGIDSLRPARTDVLLLNPDAVISSDQIDDLQHCLRADGRTAAVSPSLVSPATNQSQRVMWPFPSPSYAWLTAIGLGRFSRRADFLIGAVLLLRAEAVTGIGVLDERYFLYAEEVDWQLRAHRAGWRVRHCPEITGAHVGAGTGGDPEWRDAMFHASAERFIRKWYGARGWASFRAAVVVREAVRSALFSGEARRAAKRRLGLYLRGPIDALASLPGPIDVN